MEIIFEILKHLSGVLTPTEFALVIALLLMASIVLTKAILKLKSKSADILGLFGAGGAGKNELLSNEVLQQINELNRLYAEHQDELIDINSSNSISAASHQYIKDELQNNNTSVDKISVLIHEIRDASRDSENEFRSHREAMAAFKTEIQQSTSLVARDLELIKQLIGKNDAANVLANENIKHLIQRNQDVIHRVSSQLEKVDEFARAAIPEFRTYHKELSKEVGELNRDIALVERSIQTQINSSSVKLR